MEWPQLPVSLNSFFLLFFSAFLVDYANSFNRFDLSSFSYSFSFLFLNRSLLFGNTLPFVFNKLISNKIIHAVNCIYGFLWMDINLDRLFIFEQVRWDLMKKVLCFLWWFMIIDASEMLRAASWVGHGQFPWMFSNPLFLSLKFFILIWY